MSAPLGEPVPDFTPPPPPGGAPIAGRFVTLEPLDPDRHAAELFAANRGADAVWTYLGYGPFPSLDAYCDWQSRMAASTDPVLLALRDVASGLTVGVAAFLRIDRANGVIEIGHIQMSPALQRTSAASEAIMLMIRWAFEAGYRRVEWKCDALNAPSMRAADRFGFRYEGIFRQHMIVKGRNRDTAWWAITDRDWPAVDRAHRLWLAAENFTEDGRQVRALGELMGGASERG